MTCATHHLASQGASPRGEATKKAVDCVGEGWAMRAAVVCGGEVGLGARLDCGGEVGLGARLDCGGGMTVMRSYRSCRKAAVRQESA